MEVDIKKLQTEIVDNFYAQIGEAVKTLTEKDKALIQTVAKDAATLTFKSLTGNVDEREIKMINATLANLVIAKYFPMKTVFWAAVQRAGTVLVSVMTKAAISAVIAAV